ncbi:hypothetical protein BGW80DRAFT_1500780 [Lactifluus volemus]|nr:hypothetical protein BGW80DRAFT_1500780 [Lactifluus volemus]
MLRESFGRSVSESPWTARSMARTTRDQKSRAGYRVSRRGWYSGRKKLSHGSCCATTCRTGGGFLQYIPMGMKKDGEGMMAGPPHHTEPKLRERLIPNLTLRSPFPSPRSTSHTQRDTAGQERFSSLSTTFFRGADAALLMFDVNQPATLHALTRWWSEFRTCAPLADEDMEEYCLVVLISDSDNATTTMEEDALRLIDELIPPSDTRSTSSSGNASGRERLVTLSRRQWIRQRRIVRAYISEGIILLDETSFYSGWHPHYPGRRRR